MSKIKYDFQIGDRFGKLTVSGPAIKRNRRRLYPCKCDCGSNIIKYYGVNELGSNKVKNCVYCSRRVGSLANNGYKICGKCKIDKSISEFHFCSDSFDKLNTYCKLCRRNIDYIQSHGISLDEYNILLINQNNKCAICGIEANDNIKLFIDHNHNSSKIRGLLCLKCNSGLGFIGDSISNLQRSKQYLLKYNNNKNFT